MSGHYHWAIDHRMTVVQVKGALKATCHCGEQSPKGTRGEVERWMKKHQDWAKGQTSSASKPGKTGS